MILKYCGQCSKKLVIRKIEIGTVLFCKKCHLFFPRETEWHKLKPSDKTGSESRRENK